MLSMIAGFYRWRYTLPHCSALYAPRLFESCPAALGDEDTLLYTRVLHASIRPKDPVLGGLPADHGILYILGHARNWGPLGALHRDAADADSSNTSP